MYGTVARLRTKPGSEAQMRAMIAEQGEVKIPGLKGELVYRSDRDPDDYFLAVMFESKAAYEANASSPEQHQRYLRLRELLVADPEWHDGEIVHAQL
jgi:heme-degrading monooxygenase HmoA